MDEIEDTLKELQEMRNIESQFLNSEEAKQFINSCSDPITRELLWTAYATLIFRMAPVEVAGKFDVLFFIRVVSEMVKDRQQLVRLLSGDILNDSE